MLHRVCDWIDREYAQRLKVEALAGDVHISARHLSREFRRVYGESPCGVRDCAVPVALRPTIGQTFPLERERPACSDRSTHDPR